MTVGVTNMDGVAGATEEARDDSILNPESGTGQGDPEASKEQGGTQNPEDKQDDILDPEGSEKTEEKETEESPEVYENFTLPEGFEMEEEDLAIATEYFKGNKFSQNQAQEAVDAFCKVQQRRYEKELNSLALKRKEYIGQIQKRPDYQEARPLAQRGMKAVLTTPEAVAMFKGTWLQNHPVFFEMFHQIGKLVSEDSFSAPGLRGDNDSDVKKRFPNV